MQHHGQLFRVCSEFRQQTWCKDTIAQYGIILVCDMQAFLEMQQIKACFSEGELNAPCVPAKTLEEFRKAFVRMPTANETVDPRAPLHRRAPETTSESINLERPPTSAGRFLVSSRREPEMEAHAACQPMHVVTLPQPAGRSMAETRARGSMARRFVLLRNSAKGPGEQVVSILQQPQSGSSEESSLDEPAAQLVQGVTDGQDSPEFSQQLALQGSVSSTEQTHSAEDSREESLQTRNTAGIRLLPEDATLLDIGVRQRALNCSMRTAAVSSAEVLDVVETSCAQSPAIGVSEQICTARRGAAGCGGSIADIFRDVCSDAGVDVETCKRVEPPPTPCHLPRLSRSAAHAHAIDTAAGVQSR
jgi:hypothetical protein